MKATVNNFQMSYSQAGSGIALVFIHGFPLNGEMWQPQLEELKNSFNVITPDLRGFGNSEAVPGPYTMQLLADDINTLLDVLVINQPVVICGHSMGGYIAFEFYRRYPQRTAGLILAATRAAADSPEVQANRDQSAQNVQQNGITPVVEGMLPKLVSPETFETNPKLVKIVKDIMMSTSKEGTVGALMAMKDRPNSFPMLQGLKVPALLIHGREDQIIQMSEAEQMANSIPENKLVVINRAGHLPNLENQERFNMAVRNFILSL